VGIQKGQLYQKGKHGEVYKVLDITSENINGFKREEAVIGNLKTNQASSVSITELSDGRIWKACDKVMTVLVQKEVVQTLDGKTITISEKVVDGKKALSKPQSDIVIKKYPNTQIGKAMEKAVEKSTETKTVNIAHISNIHALPLVKEEEEEEEQIKLEPKPDHKRFAHYKYDALHTIGQVFGSVPSVIKQSCGTFHKGMSVLHQQCLDRFRDGDITLYQLREYCPNSKTGGKLSLEGTIARLNKAIWHYGTEAERKHYGW